MADLPYGHVVTIPQHGSVDDPTAIRKLIWQTKAWWNNDFIDSSNYIDQETYTVSAIDQGKLIRLKEQYTRADGSPGVTNLYSNELQVTNEIPPGGSGDQLGNPVLISGAVARVGNHGLPGKIFVAMGSTNVNTDNVHPDLVPYLGRRADSSAYGYAIAMSVDQGNSFILQDAVKDPDAILFGGGIFPVNSYEKMPCHTGKYLDYSGNTLVNVTDSRQAKITTDDVLYVGTYRYQNSVYYGPVGNSSSYRSDLGEDPVSVKSTLTKPAMTTVEHPTKDYIMVTLASREWLKIEPKSKYLDPLDLTFNSTTATWGDLYKPAPGMKGKADTKVWWDSYDDSWYMWFCTTNFNWDFENDPLCPMMRSTDDGETWSPVRPYRVDGTSLFKHPDQGSFSPYAWVNNFYRMAPNKVVATIGWYGWNNKFNTLIEAPSMEGPWSLVDAPYCVPNDGDPWVDPPVVNHFNLSIAIDGKYLFYTVQHKPDQYKYSLVRLELI